MSDTYNYDEGSIHNDHKKVLQIGNIGMNDVGKLLGAFFGSNIEDAVIVGDNETERRQDDEVMEKAKVLTENANFMTIMQKAVEQGFCQQDGWQYRWQVKVEAAYFASVASYTFGLSKKRDHDGDECISWIPFEALFGLKGLRLSYNDYQKCATKVKRKDAIDSLFR
ncbi:MAG: hypothetical protein K6A67_02615 [Bacteroidales bacterium]|nr:hypothetical protein [Bacteroidales bacterium]